MEARLFMARSRPIVTLCAAISIDGKIATKSGDSKLSSKKDLIRLHRLRAKSDAVLIGTNTLHRDDPLLTVRHARGKNPIRIILDSKGTISSHSRIIKTSKQIPTIIAVSKSISAVNLKRLGKFPVDIIVSGSDRINIKQLLSKLVSRDIQTILVEGGGTVNGDFIKNNLIDRLIVTISPKIIGSPDSISLVEGVSYSQISRCPKLCLTKTLRIRDELVLYYSQALT